jgi:tetratricopeptide (TPR) repeat protein
MLVRAGHITAVVETNQGRVALDFGRRLSPFRLFRVMDDVESIAHFHNNRAYELIRKAREQNRPVDWKAVAKRFELATVVLPGFARAWNNLGVARARQGQSDLARTAYRRAIQADPEFPSPHTNLGILHLEAQRLPEALAAFSQATELDPDSARAHYHTGVALLRAGRRAEMTPPGRPYCEPSNSMRPIAPPVSCWKPCPGRSSQIDPILPNKGDRSWERGKNEMLPKTTGRSARGNLHISIYYSRLRISC